MRRGLLEGWNQEEFIDGEEVFRFRGLQLKASKMKHMSLSQSVKVIK